LNLSQNNVLRLASRSQKFEEIDLDCLVSSEHNSEVQESESCSLFPRRRRFASEDNRVEIPLGSSVVGCMKARGNAKVSLKKLLR
jgi:hypothetical protein